MDDAYLELPSHEWKIIAVPVDVSYATRLWRTAYILNWTDFFDIYFSTTVRDSNSYRILPQNKEIQVSFNFF